MYDLFLLHACVNVAAVWSPVCCKRQRVVVTFALSKLPDVGIPGVAQQPNLSACMLGSVLMLLADKGASHSVPGGNQWSHELLDGAPCLVHDAAECGNGPEQAPELHSQHLPHFHSHSTQSSSPACPPHAHDARGHILHTGAVMWPPPSQSREHEKSAHVEEAPVRSHKLVQSFLLPPRGHMLLCVHLSPLPAHAQGCPEAWCGVLRNHERGGSPCGTSNSSPAPHTLMASVGHPHAAGVDVHHIRRRGAA